MRIRKRPLPFLLPVAPSDPLLNLNRPPPVPVALHTHPDRRIGATNGRDSPPDGEEKRARQELLFEDQGDDDDIRKENISSAQRVGEFHLKSSPKQHPSSSQAAPVLSKKRSRPKSVKKLTGDNDRDDDGENESSAGRKKPAPALMEGSRCSRVNGRGWRCCQQTLVGYSLCEHHLGKGRLRSMTAVRASTSSRPVADETRGNFPKTVKSGGKKMMKLGMVKARSISSLLGQTSDGSSINPPVDRDQHNG